jgi:hypothetical protein
MSDSTAKDNPTNEAGPAASQTEEAKQSSLLAGADDGKDKTSEQSQNEAEKPDDEKSETQEKAEDAENLVPEKYDIKVPEGMSLDTEALEKFTPLAKELKLSNEQAQKLADIYAERQDAAIKAQREAYTQTVEGWKKEVKADKEIGGTNLPITQATCRKALSAYDPDGEFTKLMDESGFGNHPAVLRFVNRVGKSVREDQGVKSSASAPKERDINKILYGDK